MTATTDAIAGARRYSELVEQARRDMLGYARYRRAAILDAHTAGLSIRRIAVELGCSPSVVQAAIRTARAAGPTDTSELS